MAALRGYWFMLRGRSIFLTQSDALAGLCDLQ